MSTSTLIRRAVKGGANPADAQTRLTRILQAHSGDNLAYALVYEGFATEAQASKYINSITV